MHFAAVLMSEWTVKGAPPGEDLDPVFLQDLRDLKACFTNDREILAEQRNLVKSAMISNSSPFHHPPQLHHPHLPHHPSLSSTTGSTASTSFASTAASSSISSPLPNAQLSSYLGAGAGAGGADNSTATTTMTTTTQPPVHASSLSSFASASAPQAQAPISSSTPGSSTSFPHTSEKHHLPSISSSASSSSSSTVALPHVTGPAWPKLSVEEREQNYNKKVFPIFKTLVRNLLTIGAGLSQSKELRDVFIDLVEKIVEPCRDADWTVEDMEYFFTALLRTFDSLESINRGLRMRYSSMYQRYIRAVMLCSCRMLKRLNKN